MQRMLVDGKAACIGDYVVAVLERLVVEQVNAADLDADEVCVRVTAVE